MTKVQKENVEAVFTATVKNVTYNAASWWAIDARGFARAGPRNSLRVLRGEIAAFNRLVKAGSCIGPALSLKVGDGKSLARSGEAKQATLARLLLAEQNKAEGG